MRNPTAIATNKAVLEALGLQHLQHVSELNLRLVANFPPTLSLVQVLTDSGYKTVNRRFKLEVIDDEPTTVEPPEPPCIDTEAMAQAARERVAEAIEVQGRWVMARLRSDLKRIEWSMDLRLKTYLIERQVAKYTGLPQELTCLEMERVAQ